MTLERLLSSTAGLATPALVVDLDAADRNIAARPASACGRT